MPLNGTEFDPGAVEMINGSKPDGPQCARFKSHTKEKDKRNCIYSPKVVKASTQANCIDL